MISISQIIRDFARFLLELSSDWPICPLPQNVPNYISSILCIMVILEGEWEILKNNAEARTFRGESGLGLISDSLINSKIWTVSANYWIGEETAFYNKPLSYLVRSWDKPDFAWTNCSFK